MTGAKYFSDQLALNGGNVLKAIGYYNGWPDGMTVVSIFSAINVVFRVIESILQEYATRMRYTACHAQNNLD